MLFIGGVTLHSFCGIGAGDAGLQRCIDLGSRPASAQAWRKCKRLIIDEISMVDGEYFEVSFDEYWRTVMIHAIGTHYEIQDELFIKHFIRETLHYFIDTCFFFKYLSLESKKS